MNKESGFVWKKTGKDVVLIHCPEHEEIGLWYARRYTARESFSFSETNNLIQNFKKPVTRKPQELRHKKQAIDKFVEELKILFLSMSPETRVFMVPAPCSKTKNHPEYDDRLEQVVNAVADAIPGVTACPILVRAVDGAAQHLSNEKRDPELTYKALSFELSIRNSVPPRATFVVVDDVITTGATFTACRKKLLEGFRDATVYGVFWAKAEEIDWAASLSKLTNGDA